MLLHVTLTHPEENCPGYHRELIPGILAGLEKMDDVAKSCGVKVHFLVTAPVEHTFFALLEADNQSSVARFCMEAIPIPQTARVTPVESREEVLALGRALAAS